MKNWLDCLDLQLLEIRNQYGHTYYQGFKSGNLNTNLLRQLSERKKKLLPESDILTNLNSILNDSSTKHSASSETVRKANLLYKLLEKEQVDGSQYFASVRAEVQRKENEFIPSFGRGQKGYSSRRNILSNCECKDSRREAYYSLQPLLKGVVRSCHELIKAANALSAELDYSNYFELCISSDDLCIEDLNSELENVLQSTEEDYQEFIGIGRKLINSSSIEISDLAFIQSKLLSEIDQRFSNNCKTTDLKKTLDSFSIDLNSIPVSIEIVDTSNAGACFVLGSDDLRLILGTESGYFGHYVAFHEFGHALHYLQQPESALLADSGICLEVMADFFASLLVDPSWLSKFTSMTDMQITSFLRLKKLSDSYRIRTMVRDTKFESEIFRYPDKSFETTWKYLTRDILGVSSKEAIWDPFSVYRPAYTKNYVYSHFLSKKLAKIKIEKYGSFSENPEALVEMFSKVVKSGNLHPFNKRLKNLGIDARNLAEDISL